MTEQELEKLFKSKLGSDNYQYSPAAWNAMENLLNQKATRGGAYFWRSAAAILAFGALVASLNFWQYDPHPASDSLSGQSTEKEAPALPPVLSEDLEKDPSPAIEQTNGLSSSPGENIAEKGNRSALPPADNIQAPVIPGEPEQNQFAEANATQARPTEADQVITEQVRITQEQQTPLLLAGSGMASLSPGFPVTATGGEIRPAAVIPHDASRMMSQAFYLKGGTVLNESYNTGDVSLGFHLGGEYQFAFAHNFNIGLGVNFTRVNKVGIHQQFDSTFYDFASERIETEITGNQLNYLEIPLSLSWRFHPRHQIGLAGYFSFLLKVTEDVEKRHYRQNEEVQITQGESSGTLAPYENYDYGLGLSYFYRIDRQFEVGVEFRRGLMDITRDTESVYMNNHQNMNTRLSLRYRIL